MTGILMGVKNNKLAAKIDYHGSFFPVYYNDTLETVCNRYVKGYPQEVKEMCAEMDLMKADLHTEAGVSRDLKLLRVAAKIPIPIFYAMKFLDDDFWHKSNIKNYRRFAQIMPKLTIGRM